MVASTTFSVQTAGFSDVHDITEQAARFASSSGAKRGILCAFVPGSTAGITTIEFEEGALDDLTAAIERLAPQRIHYAHDSRWGDGNGFAHVRAALLGPSIAIPIQDGALQLGTWQQIILIDFDNRPRRRDVILQIVGE